MAVIKTIKTESGGEIRIHDDYCKNKSKEEVQKVIDEVSLKVMQFYKRKAVG